MLFTVGSSICKYISNPSDIDRVQIKNNDTKFKRKYDKYKETIVYICNKESLLNYLEKPRVISDWGILAEKDIMDYLNITKEESLKYIKRYLWHIKLKLPMLPPKRLWVIANFLERTDLIQTAHDLKLFDERFDRMCDILEKEMS